MDKKAGCTIKQAEKILKELGFSHLIIIGYDNTNDMTTVSTYGKDQLACEQSAIGGNWLKEHFLNWPKELCNEESSAVLKLKKENEKLKTENKKLKGE